MDALVFLHTTGSGALAGVLTTLLAEDRRAETMAWTPRAMVKGAVAGGLQ